MTDNQINYIGFAVLLALFWYVQIYRPRKKMINPRELRLKQVMNKNDQKLYEAIKTMFPSPYIVISNICLDDLLFSQDLNKKAYFHKSMRQQNIAWLILDSNITPQLAVDYSTTGDEMKLNYLSQAGIGCCIFEKDTTLEQIKEILQEAATSLQEINNIQNDSKEVSVIA